MNPWLEHVKKVRKKYPKLSYKEALVKAKSTYKKKQKGGNAKIANEVYKKDEDRKTVDGYVPSTEHKEKRIEKFEKDGKVIISVRGTDVTDPRDLANDALILTGLNHKSNRYKRNKKFVQDAIDKHGKENVEIVGHSLGGNIAKQLSRDLDVKAKVYNPGAGPRQLLQGTADRIACKLKPKGKRCRKAKLTTTYRTALDPVSLLGISGVNTKTVKQKGLDPHTLKNFKGLGKKKSR